MKAKVGVLGEILIDLVRLGDGSEAGSLGRLEAFPGGAPANVAVGLARLGTTVRFLGKVAHDGFGHALLRVLQDAGVDASGVVVDETPGVVTGLSVVTLDPHGERSFELYRQEAADGRFSPDDLDAGLFEDLTWFHTGTVSLAREPSASATWDGRRRAIQAGCLRSVDLNLRRPIWADEKRLRQAAETSVRTTDVIKCSEDEARFVLREPRASVDRLALALLAWGPALAVVTAGGQGAWMASASAVSHVEAVNPPVVRDTTGAGDAFMAGLLHGLSGRVATRADLAALEVEALDELGRFAGAVASWSLASYGAMTALATETQARGLLAR